MTPQDKILRIPTGFTPSIITCSDKRIFKKHYIDCLRHNWAVDNSPDNPININSPILPYQQEKSLTITSQCCPQLVLISLKSEEYNILSITILEATITQESVRTTLYHGSCLVFYQASFNTFNFYSYNCQHECPGILLQHLF